MKPTIAYLLMALTGSKNSQIFKDLDGKSGIQAKIAKRTPKGKRGGKK